MAVSDTFDTYQSALGGPLERGAGTYVVRVIRPTRGQRWELIDTWHVRIARHAVI